MSSFRYRKNPATKAVLAALSLAVITPLPAAAQNSLPPAVTDTAAPVSPAVLPGAGQDPASFGVDGAQKPATPPVQLPEGATIDGSREKVRAMATEAGRSLEELIGTAVTPRTETEVGAIAARQRSIMMLKMQLEEAKLAKELWIEMNRESKEENEELEKLTSEKARLEEELAAARAQQQNPSSSGDPDPVVAEITGSLGSMRAKILVPYSGQVYAERGTVLPNGMKVVSISKSGVRVTSQAGDKTLSFGTSVPLMRIPAAGGMQVGNPTGILGELAR